MEGAGGQELGWRGVGWRGVGRRVPGWGRRLGWRGRALGWLGWRMGGNWTEGGVACFAVHRAERFLAVRFRFAGRFAAFLN